MTVRQRFPAGKKSNVLIVGVNPFEDLPGYQLLGLLRWSCAARVFAADDSEPAARVLSVTGAEIHSIPKPLINQEQYIDTLLSLCSSLSVDLLVLATDAHLSAVAQNYGTYRDLLPPCPGLAFLSQKRLFNKWATQDWLSGFTSVPATARFRGHSDLGAWERRNSYPVMVKGMRKGGIKCEDATEAMAARSALMRNPANAGPFGGAYLEAFVPGEEHSLLIVTGANGNIIASLGIRKLATTVFGTTLIAQTEVPSDLVRVEQIVESLGGPAVVELEYRLDPDGTPWVFEANWRFPSWIGALGSAGQDILEVFLAACLDGRGDTRNVQCMPASGSLIYRLPESGYLPLQETWCVTSRAEPGLRRNDMPFAAKTLAPLWQGCSPHQFLVK